MARAFSSRSRTSLQGVHPDLIRVVKHALQISPVDFTVIEGLRTLERQKQLVRDGASKTLNSRHIFGMAVDLLPINPANGKGEFDWKLYHQLAPAVKKAAEVEGVPITWGGDWVTFKDGPHFELPHALYPNDMQFRAVEPDNVVIRGHILEDKPVIAAPNPPMMPGPQPAPAPQPVVVSPAPFNKYTFRAGGYTAALDSDGNLLVTLI